MTEKATAQDVIDTLRSIDASLKLLVAHFGCNHAAQPATSSRPVARVATDADLDGKYGDPAIRMKDPRDWVGESQLGKPMSECPAAYLDLMADRWEFFAEKETDEKKARYNQLDASRARGWAARLRAGWTPPVQEPAAFPSDAPHADAAGFVDDDSIPF